MMRPVSLVQKLICDWTTREASCVHMKGNSCRQSSVSSAHPHLISAVSNRIYVRLTHAKAAVP